ncbi:molecular chaperone TorD family protein [Aliivibrio sp. SR45-2]|uniref:molecular chaperone TorD family protein n=1 Tax=Aliivibrio sp. SR45-2 TaxID=2760931 RepID=UPI0015FE341F|nr:molecular chaperone TorD family protein [Aliivibrio sp. SR45-2]MBB1312052.1 molecular chaperone TorD family protein [Aliivibrio sp. SR45-2]
MENVIVVAKLLGSFFYYPLSHQNNVQYIEAIKKSEDLNETGFSDFIQAYESTSKDDINSDFQALFEGCDVMPAPPWGSVYLDREQVIFGDSTLRFRQFLLANDIELNTGMREPEDQFGLSLLAMAMMIEQDKNEEIIIELLSEHLLPWAYHYLELVKKNGKTEIYTSLACVAFEWLALLQKELNIIPHNYKLYF